MGFPKQEYWSGWLFPFPGDLDDPGIKPISPALQADSLLSEPQEKPHYCIYHTTYSGEGNDNPVQYSCLENPMDGGVWQAIVHGVTKSQT